MAVFSTAMDQMEGRTHQLSVFTAQEFELQTEKSEIMAVIPARPYGTGHVVVKEKG